MYVNYKTLPFLLSDYLCKHPLRRITVLIRIEALYERLILVVSSPAVRLLYLFKHQAPEGTEPEIKVIGIRHGEKMYETLLTKEEAAKAIDMGNFYAVPADNRDLNYDKYFKEGDTKRALIDEFNSNNTRILNLKETKEKIASLQYIQNELNGIPNLV